MKRLKVIVVGAKFGEVYLQVLLRRKDLVDVVGILGKGGQHSLECSTKYNIPLYTSVSELPSGIDLACVIVRAGVMGGEGIQLSKELLQKGISVLHEQPIHYKELKECYVIAKKQKCFMGVSNLYRYIDATQSFIDLVNHLKKEEYVEYINVECGHQILYSVLSILFDLTDYARPFVIEQVITDIGPFDILYCRINDIPCILKIHNEVNSDDPDNFFYLFYKMQVGFKSGELQLEDPAGPILWYSRFVIPPDFNYEEKNCKEFDKSNVVIISEGSKYYDIFWNKWGEAIIKQVVIAGDYIIYDKAYNSNIQKQLYQSKQWHEVMKNIGYPREKSVCSYEENTIDRIQEFIYKKNIQKCDFASIFSNLNRKKILEIKHKLDRACLYSMLFTLKSKEKVFVGDILEVKKPYISERGKKDFSYVIDRWIKALIDNHMIGQENNCAISRIELCALDVEEAWKEAKRTWIGTLSDSVVIDYYYRNAKHLEELLADNLNATYLLFTEGKMDVAEDFYTNTLIARYLNHIISDKIFHFYKNKKTIVDIESIKKYVKDMGINVAPKTLHWKRKNCKGKYANYSYFIPRNVKLPFIVSRYEPRQKSLETVHQNGAKKIAYIKIEVGKQEYKELFKLVKDDDRIQLIKGRDTHICEIGIEGLSNSIKICNVLIKAVPQYMIPKKIVVWDSFPLTFNGKIDRKRIDENYSIEEMQKHMEGMSVDNNSANELLLMWREALHNSEIQLQDNLYDYGVDSLIMAQMASKIRNNYTKNEIPFDVLLRQLLNHPDVLSLYQYIENYSMPDKKLVQNIKNDGIGTINIFHENKNDTLQVLLHAGFGTMNCFRYLIEYMRLDNKGTIAGIAIKNSKRYCEMNPDNLIEILADEYVNLIIGLNKKKIQIIGYCISGLIAVEIARRLMERGLEIFDLVLIDSHPIQYQLEDELLMEITFLPSLGIEISQLGLGEISNEELYKAVLYLYNEFKKEIPSRSIQYLPDEYINLKKILLKLDCIN